MTENLETKAAKWGQKVIVVGADYHAAWRYAEERMSDPQDHYLYHVAASHITLVGLHPPHIARVDALDGWEEGASEGLRLEVRRLMREVAQYQKRLDEAERGKTHPRHYGSEVEE